MPRCPTNRYSPRIGFVMRAVPVMLFLAACEKGSVPPSAPPKPKTVILIDAPGFDHRRYTVITEFSATNKVIQPFCA